MKLQIVQLEPYDDVTSVRDRLASVRAERTLLVWPRPDATPKPILSRKLDLILIQREAARRGTWLALVTTEPDVIDVAAALNISVFRSVGASQRGRWKRPRNKVFVDRADRPDDSPDPRELMLQVSRLRVLSPRQRLRRRAVRIGTAMILGLALLIFAYVITPGAEIVIFPAQAQINATLTLIADPALSFVDVEGGRIPAILDTVQVESRASIPTTGRVDVPTTLASGSVVFTNRVESAVVIPDGTIVTTPGQRPARFRTLGEAVVGAGVGQEVRVPIQATEDTPGPAGNIEANLIVNIEGTLARALSVRNLEATRGGSVREQGIVTRADYDNLVILARERVRQDALARLGVRLGGTQFVVPESIRIVSEGGEDLTYDAFIGDAADTLTVTIRARVQALIIDVQAARQAALARLSASIPPGRRLIVGSITYTRGAVRAEADGTASLVISSSGNVAAAIDAERVRNRVAGMSVEAALNTLNREWLLDPLRPPQIQVWPGFLGQLPVLPVRIAVTVQ